MACFLHCRTCYDIIFHEPQHHEMRLWFTETLLLVETWEFTMNTNQTLSWFLKLRWIVICILHSGQQKLWKSFPQWDLNLWPEGNFRFLVLNGWCFHKIKILWDRQREAEIFLFYIVTAFKTRWRFFLNFFSCL